jgi:hypothetical protein
LVAAQKINGEENSRLFGIVSNGKLWEFGFLQAVDFVKNVKYYVLEDLQALMEAVNFIFKASFEQVNV